MDGNGVDVVHVVAQGDAEAAIGVNALMSLAACLVAITSPFKKSSRSTNSSLSSSISATKCRSGQMKPVGTWDCFCKYDE
ncbi:hypothetical protein ACFX13_003800 [Malus domestica]